MTGLIDSIVQGILLGGLYGLFAADSQRLQAGHIEVASLRFPSGIAIGVLPLITLGLSVAIIAGLQWVLYKAKLGRASRATSDDATTAGLMGVNAGHLFGVATGIAFATVAIAGVFTGIRASFDPASGPDRLLFAFEAIIIGGLGSLWATLLGGVLLGVSQSIGARLSAHWQVLAGHIAFLTILVVHPSGLFPKRGD